MNFIVILQQSKKQRQLTRMDGAVFAWMSVFAKVLEFAFQSCRESKPNNSISVSFLICFPSI